MSTPCSKRWSKFVAQLLSTLLIHKATTAESKDLQLEHNIIRLINN